MIAYLRGLVWAALEDQVVVDVGGVGYQVFASRTTLRDLPALGSEVALHVHTHVREDAILLYGFATVAEKEVFLQLVEVTGVGPRLALAVLSILPPHELARAVSAQDVKLLTRVPGVGRKTAERLLLELRDKMKAKTLAAPATAGGGSGQYANSSVAADAIAALTALGYNPVAAASAVEAALAADSAAELATDTGALLRAALRRVTA